MIENLCVGGEEESVRKIRMMEHISLDGVIEISQEPGTEAGTESRFPYADWTAPYRTPEGFALVSAMYGERFDLLLGRRTYDLWSGFWPTAPSSPMGDRLNAATKYVVTHRPESLAWSPFQAVGPDLVEGVRALRAESGPDVIVSGSSSLTSALLEGGLVDELTLLVYPVLLGQGKRILAESFPARALALQESKALPSGIVIHRFTLEGGLRNLR